MKKIISFVVVAALSLSTCFSVCADPEPEVPVEPVIIEDYQYTASIRNELYISNHTAECKSVVRGFSGLATKIEITHTLQRKIGTSWDYVAGWNQTFNNWYAIYTTSKSSLVSGTYRLRTIAKVYSGNDYETIKIFSNTATC